MNFAVPIKGILVEAGRVVLLEKERAEWELPGGRLEPCEVPEDCLVREFTEELGVVVEVARIIDCWVFEVLPQREVVIFRPMEVADPQSCYFFFPSPPLPPLCDSGLNSNPSNCTPGYAWASNPAWQDVHQRGVTPLRALWLKCLWHRHILLRLPIRTFTRRNHRRGAGKLYAAGTTSEHLGACPQY
jgi:8-oxo-dGTP pyrophosphatase MutT (NUDIX family)